MTEPTGTETIGWMFELEGGEQVLLDTDKTAREVAETLQSMKADGYVFDNDNVIPVRRVICARRWTEVEEQL